MGMDLCIKIGNYTFAVWNLIGFLSHAIFDTYFLYSPAMEANGTYSGIGALWHSYGSIDQRVFIPELQSVVMTMSYIQGTGSTLLCFLAFITLLLKQKWAYGFQIAAGAFQFVALFSYFMPELVDNFVHVPNLTAFLAINVPYLIIPLISIIQAMLSLVWITTHCNTYGWSQVASSETKSW